MKFEIEIDEKLIPKPQKIVKKDTKYQTLFNNLKINHSFFVKNPNKNTKKILATAFKTWKINYSKNENLKLSHRVMDGGLRFWLVDRE